MHTHAYLPMRGVGSLGRGRRGWREEWRRRRRRRKALAECKL